MKKILSILLSALLAGLCACAVAEAGAVPEAVVDAFTDTWLSEGDFPAAAVEIWYEDGAFQCSGNYSLDDAGDEDYRWEYDDCRYDAQKGCIVCEGTRTHNVFDNDAMTLNTLETVTGVTATFALDGDKLIWTDSEGLADGIVFLHLSVAEELMGDAFTPDPGSLAFDGSWACGRANMDISAEDAGYKVSISWAGSAWEVAQWEYACMYDAETNTLVDSGMGTKSIVTYADDGVIASTEQVYSDGSATFAIGEDGLLTWKDDVEDAGKDMAFEPVERYDYFDQGFGDDDNVNNFVDEEGHYIIQINVPEDDVGEWHADDMSQDDSVVKLYYADTLEDTFVANYEPVGDGIVTVAARHIDDFVCDEIYTWDLSVEGGRIIESLGGSWTTSPDEDDLDPYIAGEWVEPEDGLRAMTIVRNPEKGWDATAVVAESTGVRTFTMNIRYDCELNAFVYSGGKVYDSAITDGDDARSDAPLRDDLTGSISFVEVDDGSLALNWYSDLTPEETTQFVQGE